jgi:hypothetical protein
VENPGIRILNKKFIIGLMIGETKETPPNTGNIRKNRRSIPNRFKNTSSS